MAPNILILILAIFLLRLFGQGMMTHTAYTEIGRWFIGNRGRATSLIVPGHQAGEALLPISFAVIAVTLGWQAGWIIGAALLLVFALPAILKLWQVERTPQSTDPALSSARIGPDKTVAQVASDPVFYALLTGTLAPPFIGTTIFFHQDYLIELRGYNELAFAAAFPVMALTTVIFSLVSGQLIDRYGAIRLLPFFLIPLCLAALTVGLLTPLWGIYAFMFLVGLSYGLYRYPDRRLVARGLRRPQSRFCPGDCRRCKCRRHRHRARLDRLSDRSRHDAANTDALFERLVRRSLDRVGADQAVHPEKKRRGKSRRDTPQPGTNEPVIEARWDNSIQLPERSLTNEIRAVSPSVRGAAPSSAPFSKARAWTVSTLSTWIVV